MRVAILSAAIALAGCGILIPDVHDLRVVALRRSGIDGGAAVSGRTHGQPGAAAVLILATGSDLVLLSQRHGTTVDAEAWACDARPAAAVGRQRLSVLSEVEDGNGPVAFRPERSPPPASPPTAAAAERRYSLLLFLERQRPRAPLGAGDADSYPAYDLLREPQDICLRLRGGSMLGGTWSSNTVRITADELRAALAGAAAAPGR